MGHGKWTILDKNLAYHNRRNLYSSVDCNILHPAKEGSSTSNLQQGIGSKYWPDTFKKVATTKRQRDGCRFDSSFESEIQSLIRILRGHAFFGILGGIHKDNELPFWVSKLSRRHSWANHHSSIDWYFEHSCFWCWPRTETWTNAQSNSCHSQLINSSQHSRHLLWVLVWVC